MASEAGKGWLGGRLLVRTIKDGGWMLWALIDKAHFFFFFVCWHGIAIPKPGGGYQLSAVVVAGIGSVDG